jgi:hypothetical protein
LKKQVERFKGETLIFTRYLHILLRFRSIHTACRANRANKCICTKYQHESEKNVERKNVERKKVPYFWQKHITIDHRNQESGKSRKRFRSRRRSKHVGKKVYIGT